MEAEVQIRPMEKDDWERVSEIFMEGVATGRATFQTQCPPYEEWNRGRLKCCRLVAVIGGAVAGWTALSPASTRHAYRGVAEISIYIGAAYRGKRVGEALLTALCTASERAGYWTLQSVILQDNAASIRLHERCGFRLIGYRERIGKDTNGVWRNTVLMERRAQTDDLPVEPLG